MWKVCWNKERLCWKIAKLFYFCHLKKSVRQETFGPYCLPFCQTSELNTSCGQPEKCELRSFVYLWSLRLGLVKFCTLPLELQPVAFSFQTCRERPIVLGDTSLLRPMLQKCLDRLCGVKYCRMSFPAWITWSVILLPKGITEMFLVTKFVLKLVGRIW